ncbi:hypothetical protein ACXIUS_01550 [Bosea thiooxidans]
MSGFRITKIVCPSCKGSGRSDLFDIKCLWCRGAKRLSVADVDAWSAQVWVIAGGGYIAGDHSLADCRTMEAEANAARHLAGLPELSA